MAAVLQQKVVGMMNWIQLQANVVALPDFSGYTPTLQAIADTAAKHIEWSALTRRRRVDVIVGLTLHCLLMSLHVMLLTLARASLWLMIVFNWAVWKTAAMLGLVRPLRLIKDTTEVRQQLESATVLRVSKYNLVLFEDFA